MAEIIRTVGSNGRDYPSLGAAIAAVHGIATSGCDLILELYNDSMFYETDPIAYDNSDGTPVRSLSIRAASGCGHQGWYEGGVIFDLTEFSETHAENFADVWLTLGCSQEGTDAYWSLRDFTVRGVGAQSGDGTVQVFTLSKLGDTTEPLCDIERLAIRGAPGSGYWRVGDLLNGRAMINNSYVSNMRPAVYAGVPGAISIFHSGALLNNLFYNAGAYPVLACFETATATLHNNVFLNCPEHIAWSGMTFIKGEGEVPWQASISGRTTRPIPMPRLVLKNCSQ